jgi:hypothetical protein
MQPTTTTAPTPERRSAADLQKILDSLIGTSGFVLAGDLPDGELLIATDTIDAKAMESPGIARVSADPQCFPLMSTSMTPPYSIRPSMKVSEPCVGTTPRWN